MHRPDLQPANGVANQPPYADSVALPDGRMCWWISSQTVTVIGNNFLLCQGIYMQINVSNVHLLIPTINHYRLAHQFLNIIRSYRQGCNIILNTVSLPSIYCWCSRKLSLYGPYRPHHCFCCYLGQGDRGGKWVNCPPMQSLPERFPTPY